MRKNKIILYGAGKHAKEIYNLIKKSSIEIIGITDSDFQKWGQCFEEYIIQSPSSFQQYEDAYLYVAIKNQEIYDDVVSGLHWFKGKIISFNELQLILCRLNDNFKISIEKDSVEKEENYIFDCTEGIVLGGVEAWTTNVCEALLQKGVEHTYIVSKKGEYQISDTLKDKIIYVDIKDDNRFSEDTILKLMLEIKRKLPCKIVTRATNAMMVAAYLLKCQFPNEITVVSVIHNSNEYVYKEYYEFRDCIDIYIGVSQDIKRDMIQKGIEGKNIYTMTCPFECEKILYRTYTLDLKNPIRIGYAGRMDGFEHSQKRMDLLLKFIDDFGKKGIDFRMEIAGDGIARAEMEEYINNNGLNEKVCFLGEINRSAIPAFWRKQDICVNIADFEGRSISIIEAMGNGAVPVVTQVSGTREDIINGVNGYLIPIGDYQTMADRIEYLAKHRDCLPMMGQKAHDEVYPKSLMKSHIEFWINEIFKINPI